MKRNLGVASTRSTIVVILKEQLRVTDPVWRNFLHHLRRGTVESHHITMLRGLIVGRQGTTAADFSTEPWSGAPLITPRHAMRRQWNQATLRKWCHKSGQQLFVCTASDTIEGRKLSARKQCAVEERCGKKDGGMGKDLLHELKVAIGMKVMVTENIETFLYIANGARGEIVDILLHPDEPPIVTDSEPIVRLQHLPQIVFVKLHQTRAGKLEGLQENVIPVEPMVAKIQIIVMLKNGKRMKWTVTRQQHALTAAYSFTDYRAQGQTILKAIADIATLPSGTLTLFNLYVALSRSSSRDSIQLLQDFDDELFLRSHNRGLVTEDERLENLNDEMQKRWHEMKRPGTVDITVCEQHFGYYELEYSSV